MSKKAATKPDVQRVELTVEAGLHIGAFFLREPLGEAKAEDGRRVELALNADNSVLCTVHKDGKDWRTYAIPPRAFVEAVLRAEDDRAGDGKKG